MMINPLLFVVFLVAVLYSSVGFGGASSYLAGMSLSNVPLAASAAFIVLNSLSGLAGRISGGTFLFGSMGWSLLLVGIAGGF